MSKTNCMNCGAAKDVSDLICPFCGTKYADVTTIDMFSGDPIYLQIINRKGEPAAAKAYVTRKKLAYHDVWEYCSRDESGRLCRNNPQMVINGMIEFELYEPI